jgi:predicted kinase
LWEGRPTPFDALEFDEDLATIDVGYDLAFLLMDLDQRTGRAAANRVMNRYIARTGDIAARGFPAFLSQRAFIRAHVLKATGQDDAGMKHLAAALGYLQGSSPMVLAIGGLQGTGKSTLARAVAPAMGLAPGAVILRSDEIRKRLHGAMPEQRLASEAYSDAANSATNDALVEQVRVAAGSGQSVVADATFLDLAMRRRIADAAGAAGIPFVGVWLQAPMAVLEQRTTERSGDASDATVAVLRRAAANDPGAGDWVAVDATDRDEAAAAIRAAIGRG